MKGLNESWGDGTMAAISEWRSQTSQHSRTTSERKVTEESTFTTNRFKLTGRKMTPSMEKCPGMSSSCLLQICFPHFYSLMLVLENQGCSRSAAVSPTAARILIQIFFEIGRHPERWLGKYFTFYCAGVFVGVWKWQAKNDSASSKQKTFSWIASVRHCNCRNTLQANIPYITVFFLVKDYSCQ